MNRDNNENEITGTIFDIQPFSLHDGPGIRTLIFLKGCPLRCQWCSNPESQHPSPQWMDKRDLGRHELCGKVIGVTELMDLIQKDRPYFGDDGGVTLSGGEPFSQPEFLLKILESCRSSGISTAIETSLHEPFPVIENILPLIDFFMFDIKLMDPIKHRKYCGVDNRLILENIRELARIAQIPLLPRFPLIPGINDDEENILRTAKFLNTNGFRHIQVLPYMRMGMGKYEQLGMDYELADCQPPDDEKIERTKKMFGQGNVTCL